MSNQSERVHLDPSQMHQFAISILTSANVPPNYAEMVANSLVLADLRGVDTHGLNRLPVYIARVKSGAIDPSPQLKFVNKTPVCAHLDAQNTFGFVAGSLAVDKAVEMANIYGVGIVGVKDSGHFGMAATYLLKAINKGLAAMVFTNASRAMPAWGSKESILGTSPFAVGLPGRNGDHWVLDMSPSVVARGKIRKAERRGESIPEGWALDANGKATTNASEALKGTVLPIGGPKGSGIAMMMDIFGGLLTGASFAGNVKDQYKVSEKNQGVGHWFMVFKPDMFLETDEYYDRMEYLLKTIRESEKAEGVERIYTPGEIEFIKEKENREKGVVFTNSEIQQLHKLADELGCKARLVN